MHLAEFRAAGLALFKAGLITGASGNLSIRLNGHLLITRHGSCLSSLVEADLIETGIRRYDDQTPLASSELPVHRAIYQETSANAIVHSHAPYAVALSLTSCSLPGGVPVIGQGGQIIPGAMAKEVAGLLKDHSLVVVRDHGPFATGASLQEACERTLAFEAACHDLCRRLGIQPAAARE